MPSSQNFAENVLKRVGTVKNELLAFTIIILLILNVFAGALDLSKNQTQMIGGIIMHLSSILIGLLFGGIYAYAALKLPSSQQELVFTEEAKKMVAEHLRRLAQEAK